jgi:hypothetical protein
MNDCLRQFILSLNQLQVDAYGKLSKRKVNRYLKKLNQKWKTGSNERRQYEEAYLKIVTGEYCESKK